MEARQQYELDLAAAQKRVSQLDWRLGQLVWARTILFALASSFLLLAYLGHVATPWTTVLGWLFAFSFLVAIIWNEHVRIAQEAATSDERLTQLLLDRMDRRWAQLPAENFLPEVSPPMCSDDLDVAGQCSLLTLLSLAGTHPGKTTLQSWIASPPTWETIRERQAAVKALVPERDLRLEVVRKVSSASYHGTKSYQLTQWAESPSWLDEHKVANLARFVGPGLVVLGAIGISSVIFLKPTLGNSLSWLGNAAFVCLVVGVVGNLIVTVLWGGWVHGIFQKIFGEHQAAQRFSEVFQLTGRLPDDGGLLSQARGICTQHENNAIDGFRSLKKLVRLASFQRDPVLYLVYLVLQSCLLWDLHVLDWMERWKKRFGPRVRKWFDSLGQCEAIISAATLADENPSWAYPTEVADGPWLLNARQLAHPLLPQPLRVANDVGLSGERPLLLVTGSNMAGKSTMLRAVGLNVLLSRVGSPACAETLSIPAFEIASSIRVRDSLREGVSFFMAELLRLKSVVDLAKSHRSDQLPPILFLLDEILQGTNSRERQIAVARVVEQLVSFNACGLLSTHDLDLASVPEVSAVAQVVHFRETFARDPQGKEVMQFDYIMRPGVTPTTNALKLLELVGLVNSRKL